MLLYQLYNPYHLGDNIFNFILFYQLKNYIEKHNIHIDYYCKSCYIEQVSEFNCSPNIRIKNCDDGLPPDAIELWQNNEMIGASFESFAIKGKEKNFKRVNYNLYYKLFFNKFLKKIKIPVKIDSLYYIDSDLIARFNRLEQKYKEVDLLILNSVPFSGQYDYKKDVWDHMIRVYQKRFRVATTTKVDGVLCTMDEHLTLKDIAAVSLNVKVVIAVNSGVLPALFNKNTLKNVRQFYTFDDRSFYSYPNFVVKDNIQEIGLKELEKYITYIKK
jgi:hypothetical protein